jgi:hypothetical protein
LLSVVHIFVFAPRRAVSAPVAQTATPDCRRLDRAAVDNGRRSRMPVRMVGPAPPIHFKSN